MNRAFFKQRAEGLLASRAVSRFTRRRVQGKTLILAYHAVIPSGDSGAGAGERAVFVSQDRFASHLDALAEIADVVPLDRIDEPGDDRPRVAITFDDAYQGAVTHAVDELVARKLPATLFVSPGRLGGHVFWWDALSHAAGRLDPAIRAHALDVLEGNDERVREWAAATQIASSDALARYARAGSLDELRAAAARPGILIGSHTWSHPNLARVRGAALVSELARPLAWLRAEFGARAIPWLAYPYGLESREARAAAAAAGYVSALCIVGGWHRASDVEPFARPRLNVPAELSVDGLRARLLGAILA